MFLLVFNKKLSVMQRKLNEIVPLNQCVFVIGNSFSFLLFTFNYFFLQEGSHNIFLILAESGSGKSTFIKLLIKNLNQGKFIQQRKIHNFNFLYKFIIV
jgi:ABC-type transport system involved in cytochrome bd biosynthesis fused ATPase/permease subunit